MITVPIKNPSKSRFEEKTDETKKQEYIIIAILGVLILFEWK